MHPEASGERPTGEAEARGLARPELHAGPRAQTMLSLLFGVLLHFFVAFQMCGFFCVAALPGSRRLVAVQSWLVHPALTILVRCRTDPVKRQDLGSGWPPSFQRARHNARRHQALRPKSFRQIDSDPKRTASEPSIFRMHLGSESESETPCGLRSWNIG